MITISDCDVWHTIDPDDLWLFDKLLLAKKMGYSCGPAGVAPPTTAVYVVRPCVNFRMMGRGAEFMQLSPNAHDAVPDGYFWCEQFVGRHVSFDYHWGQQTLAVEGFRHDPLRLDRFCRWQKCQDVFVLPAWLQAIAVRTEWLNVETIANAIIEIHFRFNDDFANHTANTIIPVWRDQDLSQPANTDWYDSPCGERLGFWIQK